MKNKIKQKVSPVELICYIEENMKKKGWKQADLAKQSGVSTGVLSRFFDKTEEKIGISAVNMFEVLNALGLINEQAENECPVQCNEDLRPLCEKVKIVIAASDLSYSKSLRDNIESFHEAVVEKRAATIERRKASVGRRSSDIKIAELINAVSELSDKLQYLEKTAVLKPSTDAG